MSRGILLDSCAVLWLGFGDPIRAEALAAVQESASARSLFVCPMTAWEIALLLGRGRVVLDLPPLAWYRRFIASIGATETVLDADILVASQVLPGTFHRDPADRIIVATARALDVPVVTRDRLILAYAAEGHVQALPC